MQQTTETFTLPRPKNFALQAAIIERCRVCADVSRSAVGLNSRAVHRWLARDDIDVHYTTVHRICQKMEADGILKMIEGTNEWIPTEEGRRWLARHSVV
jgi:hypothetical protein